MTIGESFAIVLSWQVQKSGCSNNEKFPARKRAVNYIIIISGNPLLQILESPMAMTDGILRENSVIVISHCECSVSEEGEVDHIHTICDVRVSTSYIQSEGRFPGEGEGGVWGCDI